MMPHMPGRSSLASPDEYFEPHTLLQRHHPYSKRDSLLGLVHIFAGCGETLHHIRFHRIVSSPNHRDTRCARHRLTPLAQIG